MNEHAPTEPLPDHAVLAALRKAAEEGDEAAALYLANYGAQNTEVDGTPFMATGPCCTGVAGVASAPSETDPV